MEGSINIKALAVLSAFALFSASVLAQQYPNGLSADSVDPETDKEFISIMRQRMDNVRKTEHRPTVALVLSGGGARGSAHVGVLKLLEEMEMPVDMICGTSMGGLVGGLYSMGYPAAKLDSLLKAQNWDIMLTDKVDQAYISFADKDYKSRYLVSIPFHYEKQPVVIDDEESVRFKNRRRDLNLDADAGDFTTQVGVNNLASSLPSGYVYGFNVNNLISSLTVGYQDEMSFTDLPIPYFSVAADVVSCKAKNWGSGSVKSAIRSTMSIPGLFDPVWTDDMVLVDGGTRNNFPVDLARAMGADYVIGVELSTEAQDYDAVNNLGNILIQFIKMLGQDAYNKNRPDVDIFIHPDLGGYNMLSFNKDAIGTMIDRGYNAACDVIEELGSIKAKMNGAKPRINHPQAVDIGQTPVAISSVEFNGVSDQESRMLMKKISHDVGRVVTKEGIDAAMQKIQATNAFETVTYSLYGKEEPYRLVFNCEKGPVHQFGVGFRMDTKEWVSALFNIGLNSNKLKGSKLDFEACINKNFYSSLHYSLDLPSLPTLNASAKIFDNNLDLYSDNASMFYSTAYRGHKETFYISNIKWTYFDLNAGIQNTHYNTRKMMSESKDMYYGKDDKVLSGSVQSMFLKANLFTLDNKYFPSTGSDLRLNGEWVFYYPLKTSESLPVTVASLDYTQAFPLGSRVRFVADLHERSVFNELPMLHYGNFIGGALSGRYWDQQIPFVGSNYIYAADRHIAAANFELSVNPFKSFYISLMAGAFDTASSMKTLISFESDSSYGFAAQLGYNTVAGPIKCRASWSSMFKEMEYYLSIGFDF
ncbi:MAG: patatin-like phospholipase family protein [Bacteroidia bacterium]|nr:patatin-like phospholipase family protein [Bacteroidia bacterium]